MSGLRVERVGYGHEHARQLIDQVQDEYRALYGGPDETPLEPEMFEPPTGSFFVGYVEEDGAQVPVATGAWRSHLDLDEPGLGRIAEIKRMYVVPSHRGRGLSKQMLAHLERDAVAAGFDSLVLETGTMQPTAIALYTAAGYGPVTPYGHYKCAPESVHLGRRLRPLEQAG
ncbi:GNAT family N-acetyltransferase [Nocardioides sp. CPCC 205120]|uniref:GNAT family N-acetyltransferase n=1 Tax=Nocardioides sp. CPCC 205120 TaxID=3406462 RepID=UPI003B50F8F0